MSDELHSYRALCRQWLSRVTPTSTADDKPSRWGSDSDDVSVFHSLSPDEERTLIAAAAGWQAKKFDAGFGAIAAPTDVGGAGLSPAHANIFREEEAAAGVFPTHELLRITVNLVAPLLVQVGSDRQKLRHVRSFYRADELCCQLFSEPNAGSDLANISTTANSDGSTWTLNGSKVWTSGAQFADWGLLLARTSRTERKHEGLTAFLVPMSAPGVEVRPLRQMTGGSSFNEVFLHEIQVGDENIVAGVGVGWSVAMAVLGLERSQSGSRRGVGGSVDQVFALAAWLGQLDDPLVRQMLVKLFVLERVREVTRLRAEASRKPGEPQGPEGSIGKLMWTQGMSEISAAVSHLLGPRLVADTGEWGTFAWTAHVLGAPGFKIAGGADEVQRNILGERILGLPREPR